MGLSCLPYYILGPDSRLMPQISNVIDRTVASIESELGTRRNSNSNTSSNTSSTPISQYSTHPQHGLSVAVKQEGYGSAAHRRPSLRSNSTTPSSMVNATEQLSIHRAPGMANTYYNPSMSTPTAAYPQMGYADLTQSALSTPTSASSSMQSSYMPAVTGESAHQYLYTTSAAASAAAAAAQMTHTPPGNSPQASHNPMVGYNNAQAAQTHHHQQQQASAGWMNAGPGAPNAMSAVPNSANPWPEWTSAIAMGVPPSSQDRYSANALMPLGSEQRGSGDPGGGGGGGAGHQATVPVPAQGGQWSMMMAYHNPNHTGD